MSSRAPCSELLWQTHVRNDGGPSLLGSFDEDWVWLSDDDDRVAVHDRRGYLCFVETSYHFCTQCSDGTVTTVSTETLFSYDCDLSDWARVQSCRWIPTFRTNLLLFPCMSVERSCNCTSIYHISLSPVIYHARLVELSLKTHIRSNSAVKT
jgi:hypothetical protein